jgi:DNA repair protein RadC
VYEDAAARFAQRVLHNRPSGDPTPSQADIAMTKAIVDIAAPSGLPCTTSSSARTGMRV